MATEKKNDALATKDNVRSDILVKKGEATAAIMKMAEDIFINDDEEKHIRETFSAELFISPARTFGEGREYYLVYDDSQPFKLRSGDTVNMVLAHAVKNPRAKVRFIESTGMRNQFIPSRVGKKFAMLHTGEVPGKMQPCQTYNFAWEL